MVVGPVIGQSISSILPVFLIAFASFTLRKFEILSKTASADLSQLCYRTFVPSLMFFRIVDAFKAADLAKLWLLALMAIVYPLIGMSIGYLMSLVFRVKEPSHRIMALVIPAFGNSSYLPLSIMSVIAGQYPFSPTEADRTATTSRALALIAVYNVLFDMSMFSLGNFLLRPIPTLPLPAPAAAAAPALPEPAKDAPAAKVEGGPAAVALVPAKEDAAGSGKDKHDAAKQLADGSASAAYEIDRGDNAPAKPVRLTDAAEPEPEPPGELLTMESTEEEFLLEDDQVPRMNRFSVWVERDNPFESGESIMRNSARKKTAAGRMSRSASAAPGEALELPHVGVIIAAGMSDTSDVKSADGSAAGGHARSPSKVPAAAHRASVAKRRRTVDGAPPPPPCICCRSCSKRNVERCGCLGWTPAQWKVFAKKLLTPPFIAGCCAFFVTSIPELRALLKNLDSKTLTPPPLVFIMSTLSSLSNATVAVGLCILGLSIANASAKTAAAKASGEKLAVPFVPLNFTIALGVAKMVIMPLIGWGLTEAFISGNWIDPADKLLQFVLLLESCPPPALGLIMLAEINMGGSVAMSRLMLLMYGAALITLPTCICLFVLRTYGAD